MPYMVTRGPDRQRIRTPGPGHDQLLPEQLPELGDHPGSPHRPPSRVRKLAHVDGSRHVGIFVAEEKCESRPHRLTGPTSQPTSATDHREDQRTRARSDRADSLKGSTGNDGGKPATRPLECGRLAALDRMTAHT